MRLDRRTVLQAGGVIAAAGVVAACGPSGDSGEAEASTPPASDAPDDSSGAPPAAAGAIAAMADIPVGGGVVIPEPPVVITQPAEGDVKAFTAICPHQGCLVSEVVDNEIICPCHGSVFSAVDGAVLEGPAREGLAPEEIVVDAGGIALA